jgi:hypothetical protein
VSLWLIIVVTGCYLITAVLQMLHGNHGFSLMWFAYAMANVGIILAGGTK